MLNLPNITLCTIGSDRYRKQNENALIYSSANIKWGAVKHIPYECKTIDDWNRAVVFELGDYIDTEFAMLVHADGYVVQPEMWSPIFTEYDFIGAPFPLPTDDFSYRDINGVVQRVGNSVSLRSQKLLRLPKTIGMEWKPFHGFYNEDGYVSVNMRHVYEAHGCKYAPLEVAKYFSRECEIEENKNVEKTFAFHKHEGRNSIYINFEE